VERRRFIVKAGGTLAVAGAAAVVDAPNVIAQPKVHWRMSTTWTPALDVLQGAAEQLARLVDEMSGGRFRIEVFPGGQLMPPLACFDAASQGTIEAFMATAYYWPEKEPALEWFTTVPFGMNPEGMAAWYYQGDGLKLLEEAHAPFNLVPRPGPAFAPQMAGWFRKKINAIGDYKGLKMRIGTGLGGKVVSRAGGTAVLTPAAEIYAALERGVIDAAEWVGPHDDMMLGLHKTARYYYYPGWHEPATVTEFGFNRKAYGALPVDLQRTLDHAAAAVQVYGLTDYHAKNAIALERLKTEFKGKGRGAPTLGAGAAGSQEGGDRCHQGAIREDPHGPQSARVLHEVPGAGGPVGPRRRRRLPSARGSVTGRPMSGGRRAP
jgi:TRAP-type mannitol/chloroaromatic compound transport system substrate-binding protein